MDVAEALFREQIRQEEAQRLHKEAAELVDRDRLARHLAIAIILYGSITALIFAVVFGVCIRVFRCVSGV